MFPPPCFLERAIHDALGRVGHLALRDIEVVLFHGVLPRVIATPPRAISDPSLSVGGGGG
jgi:hypothetical protein